MHDIAEFACGITLRPILAIPADIEIILINSSGQVFSLCRSITETGYFNVLAHINHQGSQGIGSPHRLLLSVNGCGSIHPHSLPAIHRHIAQGHFHCFVNQGFGIIQADVTDIDNSAGTSDGYSDLFRVNVRKRQQTFVSHCSPPAYMMPCAIGENFYRKAFHTLAFGDILLNQEGINQCILLYLIFFRISYPGCPCPVSLLNLIIGKGLLYIFRQFLDTSHIILMHQTALVGRDIQQQNRITAYRTIVNIHQIGK